MKGLFIATDWASRASLPQDRQYGGVGYYRLVRPKAVLEKKGWDIDMYGQDFHDHVTNTQESYNEFISQYDFVLCKQIDDLAASRLLFNACKSQNIPIIIDVDDNYLALDPWHPKAEGHGYEPGGDKRVVFSTNIALADALIVSTEPLKAFYEEFLREVMQVSKDIYVIPNTVNKHDWSFPDGAKLQRKGRIIGWHGSTTHDHDIKMVMPAIERVLDKYNDVGFEMMGGITEDIAQWIADNHPGVLGKVDAVGGTPSWYGFPEKLYSRGWVVGIAPLVDSEFNRGKSHIKWMELGLCGVPCIASNVTPYKEVIEDGKTGYLVSNEDEWVEKICHMLDNSADRLQMGRDVKKHVGEEWKTENFTDLWVDAISEVLEGGLKAVR